LKKTLSLVLTVLALVVLLTGPSMAAGPHDSVWQGQIPADQLRAWQGQAPVPGPHGLVTFTVVIVQKDGHLADPTAVAILFGDGSWVHGDVDPVVLFIARPFSTEGWLYTLVLEGALYTHANVPAGSIYLELFHHTLQGYLLDPQQQFGYVLSGERLF